MSLPTWERGLKPVTVSLLKANTMSLPTWERGLKPIDLHQTTVTERCKIMKIKVTGRWGRNFHRKALPAAVPPL